MTVSTYTTILLLSPAWWCPKVFSLANRAAT